MRLHIKETLVERCVDCPSAKSPINNPNDEWRCRECAELNEMGSILGYRIIPCDQSWNGFPDWCPLAKTTRQKWNKRELDRQIKFRSRGRVGKQERTDQNISSD